MLTGMCTEVPTKALPEVPHQIFEKFLQELASNTGLTDVVRRLGKVLLEDKNPTESKIRDAIIPPPDN